MDNYDFFNTFVTAIAGNAAIESWCVTQFGAGTKLNVFADVTSAGLPSASDMPYAIMHTPGVQKHQERREQNYSIAVDLAINKDALASTAYGNLDQPAGVELVLDLAQLVIDAVKASLPANTVMGYSLSADTLGALPEVYAYIDLDFKTELTLGMDPLG
ncbi:MAG: hypothetical protein MUC33_01370 [Desulfobacterales bacterium]|jgi:hypothetical protein|nr:hypothetical protein [Desulfobacterales bacterium]MCU0601293.1 hypothetical protein [Desulfobacterales bacterium]